MTHFTRFDKTSVQSTGQRVAFASRVPQLDPYNVAISWMFERTHGMGRCQAIGSCIDYLMTTQGMTEQEADIAAIQAYAEVTSVNQTNHIDVDASTAHVVVLRTDGGRPVAFTTEDLLAMLRNARESGTARIVERQSRKPVVIQQ